MNQPFYWASLLLKRPELEELSGTMSAGAQFWIDFYLRNTDNHYMAGARDGVWRLPWETKVTPNFEIPEYDPKYLKTFEQITDESAMRIARLIDDDCSVVLYYSGGIDSTVVLASLIKNLTKDQLRAVTICMNQDSIIENPNFYQKYINGKMNVLNSNRFTVDQFTQSENVYVITADGGDNIFGTDLGVRFYKHYNLDPNLPYISHVDELVEHLGTASNIKLGKQLFCKVQANIITKTNKVPIYSLHDFFWWMIFNIKYMHCNQRLAIMYYQGDDLRSAIQERIIGWYTSHDYQLWSMANNSNGQKIGFGATDYKKVARDYIYDLDHNEWYFFFKEKLGSQEYMMNKSSVPLSDAFSMDTNYKISKLSDPGVREYVLDALNEYKL